MGGGVSLLLPVGTLHAAKSEPAEIDELLVYVAKSIVTMEPSMPTAEAVAVANGRIVSVGTLDSLNPWTDNYKYTIDESFKSKIDIQCIKNVPYSLLAEINKRILLQDKSLVEKQRTFVET